MDSHPVDCRCPHGSPARGWARAGLFACLAALAAARLAFAQAPAPETDSAAADPPGRVARLSLIEGQVSLAPGGATDWVEAVQNRPLTGGDKLWVEHDGRAELQIGSATVHLDHDTGFGFIKLEDEYLQASLTDGAATLHVNRLGDRESILVETPNTSIVIRQPGEYHFDVDLAGDRTIVKVRSGEARVGGSKSAPYKVSADEQGTFTGLDDMKAEIEPIPPRTEFETWAYERDTREERSVSAQHVSRDVIGYEDLDDNGEWIHEPTYGYVWRPSYVALDWAPYRYGRWAYIGPWGWTWIDDAPWGFAPFHYGRWAFVSQRWCWVPGPRYLRPVYAPALVGWTGGTGVSVSIAFGSGIGWFPLGPHEVYVPGYPYTPRYIRRVNVSNTTIVNNTYITNVYTRPAQPWSYRHAWRPDAVTVVSRDQFVGGVPLGNRRVRISDRDLRAWRDDPRPPVITPQASSVLAGRVIGSVPGRARLVNDGPKSGGDYFPGAARDYRDTKRAGQAAPRDAARRVPHDLSPARETRDSNRDRVEILRAEETRTPSAARRVDAPQQPIQSFRDSPAREMPRRMVEPRSSSPEMREPQMREPRSSSDIVRDPRPKRYEMRERPPQQAQPRYVAPSPPRSVAPSPAPRAMPSPPAQVERPPAPSYSGSANRGNASNHDAGGGKGSSAAARPSPRGQPRSQKD